ncbi:hemin-degrading factor [Yersinia hibernica]|uniref:Hemin-degrading factor n=1 Tax=Yersinia enterocolitica LC20 TaxID=1443113 RepID=A0A7U4GFQ9_YEREN|nr:hemin-degrading factor [Yersinia hibernica]AHM74202.1 hemin-degrading factor [Yersinia hibernica]OVZ79038.1 hemin-degrading factor [Yersinia kristensenii]
MEMTLSQRYLNAKQTHPEFSPRDLARQLNISEAELAHARVGDDAERLDISATTLLTELEHVGLTRVMTANQHAVHEVMGEYRNLRLHGHLGLILNPRALDLRLFLRHWSAVFSLREITPQGERLSIQCFDLQGNATHRIDCTPQTHQDAWQALVAKYRTAHNPLLVLEPAEQTASAVPAIDNAMIDADWRKMTDIHQFFMLLKRHNISRKHAFRAVGDDLAHRVDNQAFLQIMNAAQACQNEIMLFVGNSGCMQIFTGVINDFGINDDNQQVTVKGPQFNLSLDHHAISESWVTRKPTKDGFISSLELLDKQGQHIVQIFGQRDEGQSEQSQWHQQLAALPAIGSGDE